MKFLAAAAFAALVLAAPARAQESDPTVDFLGYCVGSGNSTSYCACLTDALAAAVTPKQLAIYTDYLRVLESGERDEVKIIKSLKEKHGVKGKELGEALQAANTAATAAEKSCAGL
ncbi:MAG: hypothetical protein QM698_09370 [Micropepsaceae bacterium]